MIVFKLRGVEGGPVALAPHFFEEVGIFAGLSHFFAE